MVKRIKALKGCGRPVSTTVPKYTSQPDWKWLTLAEGAGDKHAGELWGDGYWINASECCGDTSTGHWQLLCNRCCKKHGLLW